MVRSRPFAQTAAIAAGVLVVAAAAAYANTFPVPFVFDDVAAVTQNPSLAHLSTALSPPAGLSVTGRPLLNLSLALNYALGGEAVGSYHALNLILHVANALLVFALLYRTFSLAGARLAAVPPSLSEPRTRLLVAFAAALLWSLHPLHTAAVTYVMQRSELLAAFCMLASIAAFSLSIQPQSTAVRSRRWQVASVVACLAGMACKETAVVTPVLILLYDRAWISANFATALRARFGYYSSLAVTWILLVALLLGTDSRGVSAGFGAGVSWPAYAATQLWALVHYLRLTFWPSPLIFDYGTALVVRPLPCIAGALVIGVLLFGFDLRGRRHPLLAWCGAVSLLLLAPTSLVPVATQAVAEHRVYLALIVPLALLALGAFRWLGPRALIVVAFAALALGAVTFQRNATYRSAISLWADTVEKRPNNARAHYNLAVHLLADTPARDPSLAEAELVAALRLEETHTQAAAKLGALRLELGRPAEAVEPLTRAAQAQPDSFQAHYQLAASLLMTNRVAEALPELATCIRLDPRHAAARANYGRALANATRYADALAQFEEALRLDPTDTSSRDNAERLRAYLRGAGR